MAKHSSSLYICQQCGTSQNKWSGQCQACDSWNSLVEEAAPTSIPKGADLKTGRLLETTTLDAPYEAPPRYISGLQEFDRVCGGGLVPGSVILVG
jgi:DNA repair protein RadA/Sms